MSKTTIKPGSQYYTGGLAELISNPTPLTYSFFKYWFTGAGSVGIGMKKLRLPAENINLPLLELQNETHVLNLKAEETTLYAKTIFIYNYNRHIDEIPKLKIAFPKLFSITNLKNSFQLLATQTKWINDPQKYLNLSKSLIASIPKATAGSDIETIDKDLLCFVWPAVVATGLLNEFYTQVLLQGKTDIDKIKLIETIDQLASKEDWLSRSISDQILVKERTLSFKEYLNRYGVRADNDYELTSPRWHEIPKKIEQRITTISNPKKETIRETRKLSNPFLDVVVELRILRSLAKREALIYFDLLRQKIIAKTKRSKNISSLTKDQIIKGDFKETPKTKGTKIKTDSNRDQIRNTNSGFGIPVSGGTAQGKILNISKETTPIPPNTVGVFPNASPAFTNLFSKCVGIIFKQGGITSHGGIVAREFGIPAIVDPKAEIKNGQKITLNGSNGSWSTN